MKLSLGCLILCLTTFAFGAESVGKYKLKLESVAGDIEIQFTIDSMDKVNISEDNMSFDISASRFFNQLELNFQSGGDEDFIVGSVNLDFKARTPKILAKCSALVDGPGEFIMDNGSTLALYKMNSKTKKFAKIKSITKVKNCFNTIAIDYPGFEEL